MTFPVEEKKRKMANTKKENKKNSYHVRGSEELKASFFAFPWKRLGVFLLIFLPVVIFYYVGMAFEWYAVLPVYFALALASGVGYAVWNRGIMGKLPKKEELNENWSEEQKEAFLVEGEKRKKQSAFLLMIFLAFLLTFFLDAVLALLDTMHLRQM